MNSVSVDNCLDDFLEDLKDNHMLFEEEIMIKLEKFIKIQVKRGLN
jgi:hypothetical protein